MAICSFKRLRESGGSMCHTLPWFLRPWYYSDLSVNPVGVRRFPSNMKHVY